MESLKTHCPNILFFIFCVLIISCNNNKEVIQHINNNYNDSIIWYENNGKEKKIPGYIDFINDTGFYKNHTSIICIYPSGPIAMQTFDKNISKNIASILVNTILYEKIQVQISNLRINKKTYLNKHKYDTIELRGFWLPDESVYLRGNNTIGGNEFLFTENFGRPSDPDYKLFDFWYTNDTLYTNTYSKQGDTLSTEKKFLSLEKIISLKI